MRLLVHIWIISPSVTVRAWLCSFPLLRVVPSSRKLRQSRTTADGKFNDDVDADLTPLAFGSVPDRLSDDLVIQSGQRSTSDAATSSLRLPLWQLAVAGSLTTFMADVTMHPIDCVKTLQQSDSGLDLNFIQTALFLYERSGWVGFYSGFATYATSDAIGGALKFSVWEFWKRSSPALEGLVAILYLWIGAALSFVASSFVIVPGELLKQQLQMNRYSNLFEAVSGIFASHGIGGFFVGYEGVLYRDVPYTMLELGLYEIFKNVLDRLRRDSGPSAWKEIAAAAATGGITALATTPFDVIKTKLMVDTAYENASFLECLITSVQLHGWTSLFAGVYARVGWILPFTVLYLPTYDALKRQLYKWHCENAESKYVQLDVE